LTAWFRRPNNYWCANDVVLTKTTLCDNAVATNKGYIVQVDLQRNRTIPFVRIGGMPLHVFIPPQSNLMYIADATRGLLSLDLDSKEMSILVTEADGLPIGTCNNIDVAKDGTVYFSDATRVPTVLSSSGLYESYHAAVLTILAGMPYGRYVAENTLTLQSLV
jgi:sugar lactone lactonase YvrE